ncbi:HaeIII family restriction endonuclease [Oculatella sp. FACHB-28]|uniref:HaeIII family restriction endonuclease n=1 Tax=Oculatella sp. FACHB-28 TaxID=2692845 RepID=UPI001689EC74|nr:HaeIII family restriction endonuclease [Oculatella sp. FACHB-28]MBD2057801.1 HaeIII family restriction endonuclease [Oculatella sp. FACHB-28]
MTPLSNLHGRVLEYLIVEEIIKIQPGITLTQRAKSAQDRDVDKLREINPTLLQQLNWATYALLSKWLEPQFHVSKQAPITIDRLPDQNQTDVTDIRITLPGDTVNLSIKHNHAALRHQRPSTTPIHCGYPRNSLEMQQFKQQYQEITRSFMLQTGQAEFFADLPYPLIEQSLYTPVCDLVAQFINAHSHVCTSNLFEYLVGSKDYYKIIVDTHTQKLKIHHFASIQAPTSLTAIVNRQYVELTLNNGWQIAMRLHTASSRLKKSPSLKFDTKALTSLLPGTIVSYP